MFDGDGAETVELQAYKLVQNALKRKSSRMCPQCGIIMNPVEYMYSALGLCPPCDNLRRLRIVKGKMA